MDDAGLSNGSGAPHELPRIRNNRSAGAESGSGMEGLSYIHPTPHELPRTDRAASPENGSRVDEPVEANGDSPSREPPSTAGPAGPAGTGAGYRVDYPVEANEDRPIGHLRRSRRLARNPFRSTAPREYFYRVSVMFFANPADPDGNQSRLRHEIASYDLATQALLSTTGLTNLHPRTRGMWFPVIAMSYAREAYMWLSMGISVSDDAPRWERVDLGLQQVTRREVLESLVVQVGGGGESLFYDTAQYDIHEDSMTRRADRDP